MSDSGFIEEMKSGRVVEAPPDVGTHRERTVTMSFELWGLAKYLIQDKGEVGYRDRRVVEFVLHDVADLAEVNRMLSEVRR